MAQYKTPGVYVQEIPSFPPSVATVSTAVPAFIGYTGKTNRETGEPPVPVRIKSLLEYTEQFVEFNGTETALSEQTKLTVTLTADGGAIDSITPPKLKDLPLMYHALDLYFKNGGGPCYVISVGKYYTDDAMTTLTTPSQNDMADGLAALEKEDEPTLIMLVDAVRLAKDDYNALCQAALLQCGKLKDRFCIFDVLNYDDEDALLGSRDAVEAFRTGVGINDLKYGAAYYPYLKTALTYPYSDDSVEIEGFTDEIGEYKTAANGLRITYSGAKPASGSHSASISLAADENFGFAVADASGVKTLTISLPLSGGDQTPSAVLDAWKSFSGAKDQFDMAIAGKGSTMVKAATSGNLAYVETDSATLAALKYDKTALYNSIKSALDKERIILPTSPAIAGVYAYVDNTTGVWKAPANVSLASVIEPIVKLNTADQEDFNIDVNAGKSVNVIRAFTGKGVVVWGARTLMGNDNEWRYINVRRLFNFVEESVQKSTAFAVFEPNTAITWLKVRAMIESFLEDLWRAGGLAGETKENAYFVNVGLGTSMTEQDILEGRMNVEIGMAAVRPAEFIILKFSHKMQES